MALYNLYVSRPCLALLKIWPSYHGMRGFDRHIHRLGFIDLMYELRDLQRSVTGSSLQYLADKIRTHIQ